MKKSKNQKGKNNREVQNSKKVIDLTSYISLIWQTAILWAAIRAQLKILMKQASMRSRSRMRTTFKPAFKKTKRFGYPNRFFVS